MAARDAIDELMNSALEFERNETASLDRFLAWFSRGTVDVQRDPGQPANEVRVMTVHGAKGLEAPVVILADATADPAKLGRTPLTVDIEVDGAGMRAAAAAEEGGALPAVRGGHRSTRSSATSEEHLRLLYVALTRAADRLIVSGVMPKAKKDGSDPRPPNSWHRDRRAGDGADRGSRRGACQRCAMASAAVGRARRRRRRPTLAADSGS